MYNLENINIKEYCCDTGIIKRKPTPSLPIKQMRENKFVWDRGKTKRVNVFPVTRENIEELAEQKEYIPTVPNYSPQNFMRVLKYEGKNIKGRSWTI